MPQSGVVEVIVRSDRGLSIRGRVVGPKGEPMPDVAVSAKVDAKWSAEAASNGDGSFVLGPLVDGEYELTASPSRLHFRAGDQERPDASLAKSAPLRARAGAQGVDLTLRQGGMLHLVIDVSDPHLLEYLEERIMDADGQAVFEPMNANTCVLAPGTYSVFLSSSQNGMCGVADGIGVRAGGSQDAVMDLRNGAKLRVKSDASASGSVEYQLYRDGRCLASRHAIDTGLDHVVPPGHIVVRTRSGTAAWSEQTVEVAAGETRELVVSPK